MRGQWGKVPPHKLKRAWALCHPHVKTYGWQKSRYVRESSMMLRQGPRTDTFILLCNRMQAEYDKADSACNDILKQHAKDTP